ncbi:MAG: helix-turn-helix domain-containing protein [Oscillospiraceae bacterium]|nr:helix-turn-helix domain-containing protein [Oscillospiraceae bacterium]MBQ9045823.1 helix-turn-helix domain-containing protein [Oscillospiraceae bacterium]
MKNVDLNYICTMIGSLSGIPIRIYRGSEQLFYYDIVGLPRDPMTVYRDEIWAIGSHVGYFSTQHFNYYGVINSGDLKIILGPTRQITNSDQELHELAFRADVAPEDVPAFLNAMKSIIPMPLESVLQMLCTVNYILNDEKLELKDIAIYDAEQSSLKETMQREIDATSPEADAAPHNTYELEQTILNMISHGDTAALHEWSSAAPAVRGGLLAKDQLRQMKNTFVVTATLASRAAIRGGLAVEDALSLSDSFIQSCEMLTAPDKIMNLQYHMIFEFAERVERIRIGKAPTKLSIAVANYVQHHLSEPISADEIAREVYLSRPHLSTKFKAETGQTLTDFILNEKTEEAKRLLRYTDKTGTAIAAYLGFSSLGHFSRVFKKYAGRTPTEYREKYSS